MIRSSDGSWDYQYTVLSESGTYFVATFRFSGIKVAHIISQLIGDGIVIARRGYGLCVINEFAKNRMQ